MRPRGRPLHGYPVSLREKRCDATLNVWEGPEEVLHVLPDRLSSPQRLRITRVPDHRVSGVESRVGVRVVSVEGIEHLLDNVPGSGGLSYHFLPLLQSPRPAVSDAGGHHLYLAYARTGSATVISAISVPSNHSGSPVRQARNSLYQESCSARLALAK